MFNKKLSIKDKVINFNFIFKDTRTIISQYKEIQELERKLSFKKKKSNSNNQLNEKLQKLYKEYKPLKRQLIKKVLGCAFIVFLGSFGFGYLLPTIYFNPKNKADNCSLLEEFQKNHIISYENIKFSEYDKEDISKIYEKYKLPENLFSDRVVYAKCGSSEKLLIVFTDRHNDIELYKTYRADLRQLKQSLGDTFVYAIEGANLSTKDKGMLTPNLIYFNSNKNFLKLHSTEEKEKFIFNWDPTINPFHYESIIYNAPIYGVDEELKIDMGELLQFKKILSRSVTIYLKTQDLLKKNNVFLSCGATHAMDLSYLLSKNNISVLMVFDPRVKDNELYSKAVTGPSQQYILENSKFEIKRTISRAKLYEYFIYKDGKELMNYAFNDNLVLLKVEQKINELSKQQVISQNTAEFLLLKIKKQIISDNYTVYSLMTRQAYEKDFIRINKYAKSPQSRLENYLSFHNKIIDNYMGEVRINNAFLAELMIVSCQERLNVIYAAINNVVGKQNISKEVMLSKDYYNQIIPLDNSYEANVVLWKQAVNRSFNNIDTIISKEDWVIILKRLENRKFITEFYSIK